MTVFFFVFIFYVSSLENNSTVVQYKSITSNYSSQYQRENFEHLTNESEEKEENCLQIADKYLQYIKCKFKSQNFEFKILCKLQQQNIYNINIDSNLIDKTSQNSVDFSVDYDKIEKTNFEQLFQNGQQNTKSQQMMGTPIDCTEETQKKISNLLNKFTDKNDLNSIQIQNFQTCQQQIVSGIRYDAIVKLNNEDCYLGIWQQADQNIKLFNNKQKNKFFERGEKNDQKIQNCSEKISFSKNIIQIQV